MIADDHIIELQTRIAFLEDHVATLNARVAQHDKMLIDLQAQLRHLNGKLKAFAEAGEMASVEMKDELPPHY